MHIAIIMDGNGRWAERRGLPRAAGHRAGAIAVRRIVNCARGAGADALTLFAFSSDNWRRPSLEVGALMSLFAQHLRRDAARLAAAGVRLTVIGRRDRLSATLVSAITAAEAATKAATADGNALELRLAIDYSARTAIASGALVPDVDLLIRTGGEQRLSDFLLWEAAYAELVFTPTMWPDFGAAELAAAIAAFAKRDRRFGGLTVTSAQVARAADQGIPPAFRLAPRGS